MTWPPRNSGRPPVSDSTGEAFYLRDEARGHFWSPAPLPYRGATAYVTRHGFGYNVFEHTERGIRSELWIYVALDAPIKSVGRPSISGGRCSALVASADEDSYYDLPERTGETANLYDHCTRAIQNGLKYGWDGQRYRRAYFDDGSSLGSASNTECQMDSIAQSWSVLSGAGDSERSRLAMAAMAFARMGDNRRAWERFTLINPVNHSSA